jgi:acyl-coenzyme A synthetase/AMP-(fatty) acid ligase/thioesterase domain-containing protein
LTYAALDAAADKVAMGLLDAVGREEHRIALRASTVGSLAVQWLAVNRAGMTGCAIDIGVPPERFDVVVSDLEPSLVLSDYGPDLDRGLIRNVETGKAIPVSSPDSLGRPPRPGALPVPPAKVAVITYTSGSTGKPKGVMSAQRRNNSAVLAEFEPTRLALLTAVPPVGTISSAFTIGATIVAYDFRTMGVAPLGAWLREKGIEALGMVPTVLRALLSTMAPDAELPDLRQLWLTGEQILGSDIRGFLTHVPHGEVRCFLAQTEAGGIYQSFFTRDNLPGDGPIPLLNPVDGAKVTIELPDGRQAAQGESGEIVVESISRAIGYWRRPELTADRFIDLGGGLKRVYTNDAGRLLSDGSLEYLGRMDHMVKVTGNRVDLGDVEFALRALPEVRDAAVVPYDDLGGSTRLWAYVVGPDGHSDELPTRVLRATLARSLPSYMVPDHLEALAELPRLPGGKVDRQLLIGRAGAELAASHPLDDEASITPAIRAMCLRWSEILGRKNVGPDDDFFELGGDSIRGALLFATIEREMALTRPVSMLLEFPTPSSLTEALDHLKGVRDEEEWPLLVAVQPNGSQPPIYLIHDGGGEIVYGRRLATLLGPNQPVYAIRAAALSGTPPAQSTLEELATYYLSLLRQATPHGPYALYGCSAGGMIAFEMALQLQRSGEAVSVLGIGDTGWFGPDPTQEAGLSAQRRGAGRLSRLVRLPIVHLRWRLRMYHRKRAPVETQRMDFTLACYSRLLRGYEPRDTFEGSALLFRAEHSHPSTRADLGWSEHCTEPAVILNVPCQHSDLGTEAAVELIAPALSAAIQAALAPVG